MANAGSSYTHTAVHPHGTEYDGWHEPLVAAVQTPPPRRPASRYEAAVIIARWIVRRFDEVFWTCKRCERWGPCVPQHHRYISNFGICESCHNETRDDDLQSDIDFRTGRFARSRFDPDYDGMDNLRWVGPRNTREHLRAWAVHDKRLEPMYLHKKRFSMFQEELMKVTWHPSRVAKWLEQGKDVLDMMMGAD